MTTLVTPEWLKVSLCRQKIAEPTKFKPKVVASNAGVSAKELMAQRRQYKVKSNLFAQSTFAIIEESFKVSEDEIEGMKSLIHQHGGIVVESNKKAKFVIFEDGWESKIWSDQLIANGDHLKRHIIHYRWVEECIKAKQIFEHTTTLHLCPQPQPTPIEVFKDVGIAFTLIGCNPVDKLVFETLSKINGFKIIEETFTKGAANYLIVVAEPTPKQL